MNRRFFLFWLSSLLLCVQPVFGADDASQKNRDSGGRDSAVRNPDQPDATAKTLRVAVYSGEGTGASRTALLEVLAKSPRFRVSDVSAAEIRGGKLADFELLVHPGGSGSKQGRALGEEGRNAVRRFVQRGGGYVGFCAGAYLATNDYQWSLGLIDAKVVDRKHWARGFGTVKLRLTPAGRKLLGRDEELLPIYYHQGPLLSPNDDPATPDYRPLATFATEIAKNGAPPGVMQGTTAICTTRYGQGRVLCFSPHPEKTRGLENMVYTALRWAAAGAE